MGFLPLLHRHQQEYQQQVKLSTVVVGLLFFVLTNKNVVTSLSCVVHVQHQHQAAPVAAASSRRSFLQRAVVAVPSAAAFVSTVDGTATANAATAAGGGKEGFEALLNKVQQAREQLNPVPKLIEAGKWDSVRAVLIEPPLSDCWAKTGRPQILKQYAEALGDVGGDELAALEAKEDAAYHLRFLDMAVYNNNFNPISVEGETNASKELIRSYYEDPKNEYKATIKAFDEMLDLSKEVQ